MSSVACAQQCSVAAVACAHQWCVSVCVGSTALKLKGLFWLWCGAAGGWGPPIAGEVRAPRAVSVRIWGGFAGEVGVVWRGGALPRRGLHLLRRGLHLAQPLHGVCRTVRCVCVCVYTVLLSCAARAHILWICLSACTLQRHARLAVFALVLLYGLYSLGFSVLRCPPSLHSATGSPALCAEPADRHGQPRALRRACSPPRTAPCHPLPNHGRRVCACMQPRTVCSACSPPRAVLRLRTLFLSVCVRADCRATCVWLCSTWWLSTDAASSSSGACVRVSVLWACVFCVCVCACMHAVST